MPLFLLTALGGIVLLGILFFSLLAERVLSMRHATRPGRTGAVQ